VVLQVEGKNNEVEKEENLQLTSVEGKTNGNNKDNVKRKG